MAYEVVMPQLGLSMESGRIARWLKQSGQVVTPGDVLLEVESDKATVEVEAVAKGELQICAGTLDRQIPVGQVIAYIVAAGEVAPGAPAAVLATPGPAAGPAAPPSAAPSPDLAVALAGGARPRSSPAARRRARELGLDWRMAAGTGPNGRIKERDVLRLAAPAAARQEAPVEAGPDADQRISPLAQQLALELGLDLGELTQRFPGRRLQREHVVQAIRDMLAEAGGMRATQPAAVPAPAEARLPVRREARREALTSMRRLIAERMGQSSHTTAPVTLTTEVDATELVRLREALRPEDGNGSAPAYNVLLAKLVACALREHPELNASLEGSEVVYWDVVNVGIAVDTPRGLVVPVLFDVATKPVDTLGAEAEDLLARARSGKALPGELAGGTFTITNLGSYRIDAFTPIINAPECAILGVGRLQRRPVVDESGAVVVRTLMYLSLTFDHRLVDGAPAARFLKRVAEYVEQPYLWLARL